MITISPAEALPGQETQETLIEALELALDVMTRRDLNAPLSDPEERALLSALERFCAGRTEP